MGGLQSTAEGGRFFSGFLSAAVPEGASLGTGNYEAWNTGEKIVAAGVIGGTASQLGGGKFGNGALTGAFGEAFNDALEDQAKTWGSQAEAQALAVQQQEAAYMEAINEQTWNTAEPYAVAGVQFIPVADFMVDGIVILRGGEAVVETWGGFKVLSYASRAVTAGTILTDPSPINLASGLVEFGGAKVIPENAYFFLRAPGAINDAHDLGARISQLPPRYLSCANAPSCQGPR